MRSGRKRSSTLCRGNPACRPGPPLTLFFRDTATTRDIRAQIYGWKKGIKTIYYIRVGQMALEGTQVQGCVSCTRIWVSSFATLLEAAVGRSTGHQLRSLWLRYVCLPAANCSFDNVSRADALAEMLLADLSYISVYGRGSLVSFILRRPSRRDWHGSNRKRHKQWQLSAFSPRLKRVSQARFGHWL